jgi:spermidine synthase
MELWFTENHTDNVKFSMRVDKHLTGVKSDFQKIDVFDTPEFGRVLVIDGYVMLTEKDEFIYHEMITHVPMAVNPNIKRILVIGAGDGGTVRELTRYNSVERIDMVEIDKKVVEICKEYIPQTASSFNEGNTVGRC